MEDAARRASVVEKMTPLNQIIYRSARSKPWFYTWFSSASSNPVLPSRAFWKMKLSSCKRSLSLSLIMHGIWKWIIDNFILFSNFISRPLSSFLFGDNFLSAKISRRISRRRTKLAFDNVCPKLIRRVCTENEIKARLV